MTKYYVKPDSDGKFPDKDTTPVLEAADGLVEVSIPTTSIQYFTRYWWMYALLDNGGVQAPGNLPDLSIDGLQSIINQQGEQMETQTGQLKQLNALLPQVQQMVTSMTQAQAQSDATVKQLQQLGMQLTQQFALLQAGTTTNDATTTDTTKEAE